MKGRQATQQGNQTTVSESYGSDELPGIDLGKFAPYLVSRLHTHFQNVLLSALKKHGLLVVDWRSLICLSRQEEAYIGDVVEFTSLPQATVSRSIKRLQDKGLLLRKFDTQDRRASLVRISPAGLQLLRQLIAEIEPAADREIERLFGPNAQAFVKMVRNALKNSGLEIVHDILEKP